MTFVSSLLPALNSRSAVSAVSVDGSEPLKMLPETSRCVSVTGSVDGNMSKNQLFDTSTYCNAANFVSDATIVPTMAFPDKSRYVSLVSEAKGGTSGMAFDASDSVSRLVSTLTGAAAVSMLSPSRSSRSPVSAVTDDPIVPVSAFPSRFSDVNFVIPANTPGNDPVMLQFETSSSDNAVRVDSCDDDAMVRLLLPSASVASFVKLEIPAVTVPCSRWFFDTSMNPRAVNVDRASGSVPPRLLFVSCRTLAWSDNGYFALRMQPHHGPGRYCLR